ncbi:hypothetical protein GE061_015239 [Apolygus lucorum]|uniref:NADPH:adrenodoxin oxidoreductase, mitochondrial n=1 Tax=Apolygus lucorum TaxID=248454 RepID=A0A8S9XKF0_APOLU|nr:hypothetical protein GE061_015239 [Apolygus lucorum]
MRKQNPDFPLSFFKSVQESSHFTTMWKRSCSFLPSLKHSQFTASHFSCTPVHFEPTKKICIIGSGPAGFYFAQNLFKKVPDISIDMLEKLPVPYGLVRYGVAPDHPEVKNVINTFEKVASNKNFKFHGNVTLGRDVKFSELRQAYHAVVLTYGCNEDRELGIPGENLPNVISARKFVGWYNGLPEDKDLEVDLSSETVVVLGQGNVAVDVSRILLSPIDLLKVTDITEYSLQALSQSKVKTVYLIGRRGPLQAAFTIKELREMTKLPGVQTLLQKEHFAGTENIIPNLPRARKRLSELLVTTASKEQEGSRYFRPTFLHKPVEILGSSESGVVQGVKFEINDIDHEKGIARGTGKYEVNECGLVLRSIGYKGTSVDSDIPFDSNRGVVVHENGVYSAGWIHTGPTGVILSTMSDAYDQSNRLIEDINKKTLNVTNSKPGFSAIENTLNSKSVVTVNFEGWKKIDKIEVERGAAVGKPREKIVDVAEMLRIGGS